MKNNLFIVVYCIIIVLSVMYATQPLQPLLAKEFAVSSTAKVDKSVAGTDITIRPLETQKYMVKLKLRNSNADKSSLAFLVAAKWLKQ